MVCPREGGEEEDDVGLSLVVGAAGGHVPRQAECWTGCPDRQSRGLARSARRGLRRCATSLERSPTFRVRSSAAELRASSPTCTAPACTRCTRAHPLLLAHAHARTQTLPRQHRHLHPPPLPPLPRRPPAPRPRPCPPPLDHAREPRTPARRPTSATWRGRRLPNGQHLQRREWARRPLSRV